jgi:hypothetical protein
LFFCVNYSPFIKRLKRKAITKAPAGHLTIAVAHLARDNKDQEHETLLLDELRHFEAVDVIRIDRALDPERKLKKKVEEKARRLLKKTGADVLIWGSVVSLSGKSAMRLYWTPGGRFLAPNPPENICLRRRPSRCPQSSGAI